MYKGISVYSVYLFPISVFEVTFYVFIISLANLLLARILGP
jgi:hypothetical protein